MKQFELTRHPQRNFLLGALFLGIIAIAIVGVLTALHSVSAAGTVTGSNILSVNQKLMAGKTLASPNNQYTLTVGADGNVVLSNAGTCSMWTTNTAGTGSHNYLVLQKDGNLVLYTGANKALWSSRTAKSGSKNYLALQKDGNLVIYTGTSVAVWATGMAKTDQLCTAGKMLSGMYLHSMNGRFTLVLQSDGNLVLSDTSKGGKMLWTSKSGNNLSGVYALTFKSDGNLILYNTKNPNKVLWTTKTTVSGNHNYLVLQRDGNLALYSNTNKLLWSTNTHQA